MTNLDIQNVLVFVTVSLASLYLIRKLFGRVTPRKKQRGAPDVPVSALLRKKRPRDVGPSGATSDGCDH